MNTVKTCKELSDELKLLQLQCNHGKGLSCIDTVIMYLDADNFHLAKVVATNEWDKISGYSIIADYIRSNFH